MDQGSSTPERDDAGRWPKGVSGNPAGRPRYRFSIREALTGHIDDTIARLVWLRDNGETHEVQLKACKEILNRSVGTPPAAAPEEDDGDRPDKNTSAVVASIIKRARSRPTDGRSVQSDMAADQPPSDSCNMQ